jgi:sortase A
LAPGDRITVVTEDHEELVFEITGVETVHVDEAPLEKIFGSTDEFNLNLITCEGVWDSSRGMYDQRLVVYSTLVSS